MISTKTFQAHVESFLELFGVWDADQVFEVVITPTSVDVTFVDDNREKITHTIYNNGTMRLLAQNRDRQIQRKGVEQE